MTVYKSDVKVGERYVDKQTGIEGTVTSVIFFQHGCERACIETVKDGEIKEHYFDVGRLTHVSTRVAAVAKRPGGGNNPPSRSKSA